MNLALMDAGAKARPLAKALEEYGDAVGLRHDKRDMLCVILPACGNGEKSSPKKIQVV